MGAVTLLVGDLDAMTRYYRDVVTLEVLSADGDTVTLGRAGRPIVDPASRTRAAARDARIGGPVPHAILFETQAALAAALYSVARHAPGTFTGSADHLVSQAFYFTDPEGNGIELYWDRARTDWSWMHGQIEMATLYLDPNAFLGEHLTEEAAQGATAQDAASVGHVHLSVGDVATARAFYVDALGFDETAAMGNQAVFVSAGGYHHHMAMNVWNSRGAGPRMPALGLGRVDLALPDADALGALGERLRHHGFAVRDDGRARADCVRRPLGQPLLRRLTVARDVTASDAVADDELGLEDRDVLWVGAREQVEQHARHALPLREGRLTHRRELRDDGCRDRRVVEADDRDVLRHAESRRGEHRQRAAGHEVARDEDARRDARPRSRMRRIASARAVGGEVAVLDRALRRVPRRRAPRG